LADPKGRERLVKAFKGRAAGPKKASRHKKTNSIRKRKIANELAKTSALKAKKKVNRNICAKKASPLWKEWKLYAKCPTKGARKDVRLNGRFGLSRFNSP
jgi:hypothetical protein